MRSRVLALALLAVAGSVSSLSAQARQATPSPTPAAAPANDLAVTVTYTGKGVVDATTNILIFLFTDPNVGAQSQPIGAQVVTKNGQTVTFKGIGTTPVYAFAIYNDKGTYTGRGGPPPVGTPVGMYSNNPKGTPTAVTPGPKAAIKMTFNGSKKFGQ